MLLLSAIVEEDFSSIYVRFKLSGNATSFVSGTAVFKS